jgi:PAS domain S-box-containing protein
MEHNMVEQEIRIKQIIENLSDAIVVSDSMGNIKYLNPASVALLGYTLKEAIGQPLSDIVTLVDEHSDEPIPNIALNAIHSGQDENCGSNSLLIGRDGLSELPVEIVARPLYTPKVPLTVHYSPFMMYALHDFHANNYHGQPVMMH